MTTTNNATLPPETKTPAEQEQRTGCGRWGCGCLLLLGLGLYLAIQLPSYWGYKEWVPKKRAESLRGLCGGGPGETPAAAAIGPGVEHWDVGPYLARPVYGCATLAAYTATTRTLYSHTDYSLPDHRPSPDAPSQNAQCRAMPEGAEVDVEELRLALFAAKVRIRGEDKAWWTPCSGLRAKEENAVQPKDKDTRF